MGETERKTTESLNQIEDTTEFLKSIIEERQKRKKAKSKIWKDIFLQHKEFILQSLRNGVSKADIHYALNEFVKRQYGKSYMIKANYFYMLLKKFLNENLSQNEEKENLKSQPKGDKTTKEPQKSNGESKDRPNKKTGLDLDEHNEGGIL